jgi:hypothetical protein
MRWLAIAVLILWTACAQAQAQTVRVRSFTATVTWTCTCVNQTGFNVYRKTGTGGVYRRVGATRATVMTFTDPGLRPNTTYVYQIGAFNEFNETRSPETVAATGKPPKRKRSKT